MSAGRKFFECLVPAAQITGPKLSEPIRTVVVMSAEHTEPPRGAAPGGALVNRTGGTLRTIGDPPPSTDARPVAVRCAALQAAVDAVQLASLSALSEAELVATLDALEIQSRRLPAVRDAVVAEAHSRGVAASHGFRSTGAWLRDRFQLGAGEARTWLRGAERLSPRRSLTGEPLEPRLSIAAAARTAGRLSQAQVKVIDDLDEALPAALPPATRREIEARMVRQAANVDPVRLTRLGQQLLDAVDPDGTEPAIEEAYRRRGITIGPLRRGLARVSGHVDAWTREAILAVLASLSDPHRPEPPPARGAPGPQDSEHARRSAHRRAQAAPDKCDESADQPGDALDHRGEPPDTLALGVPSPPGSAGWHAPFSDAGSPGTSDGNAGPPGSRDETAGTDRAGSTCDLMAVDPDRRTRPQRLHDALREACERLLAEGRLPRRGGTPATILLTVPLSTLEKRTGLVSAANGGDIPIAEVMRRAAGATIVPIVVDAQRNPLFAGRRQRLVGWQQRYALHVRDGGCVIPGCTTSSEDCHTHHLVDWIDGGRTDLSNLALLCTYHHYRIKHWTLQLKGGRMWCTPPPGIRREQVPQVNTYFRDASPDLFIE